MVTSKARKDDIWRLPELPPSFLIAPRRDSREMVSPLSVVDHNEMDKCTFPSSTIEQAVLEVLTAPFCKQQDDHSTGKVYWESILIGRRFLLILIGSFLEFAFLRSVCLAILLSRFSFASRVSEALRPVPRQPCRNCFLGNLGRHSNVERWSGIILPTRN